MKKKEIVYFLHKKTNLGLQFAALTPDSNVNSDQPMLDIDQVRILAMSHKYNPERVHVGLMIYSVDGQTDFILNDAALRIKAGDVLIHQTHHALSGQEDLYRDLIRSLFGTHRINLIGLVFTFTGNGKFTDCMRWTPTSANHLSPMHPTELKLLEIVLVSLYMNNAWLNMQMASHVELETLSQSAKKQYLLKLGQIEELYNKRRADYQNPYSNLLIPNLLKGNHRPYHRHRNSSESFRSFEWTPNRQQTFEATIQGLLDQFYNIILEVFPEGEFDRDQYAYFDDSTKHLAAGLANPYQQSPIPPVQNYLLPSQTPYAYRQ